MLPNSLLLKKTNREVSPSALSKQSKKLNDAVATEIDKKIYIFFFPLLNLKEDKMSGILPFVELGISILIVFP